MGCTIGCIFCCCCNCCCCCWGCWGGSAGKIASQIGSALTGALCGLGGAGVASSATGSAASQGNLCGAAGMLTSMGGPKVNYCIQNVDDKQLQLAPIGGSPAIMAPNPNMEVGNFNTPNQNQAFPMKKGGSFVGGGLNSSNDQTQKNDSNLPDDSAQDDQTQNNPTATKPKDKTAKKPTTLSQAIDFLSNEDFQKSLTPKFLDCKGGEMLMSQMTQHPNELQSLKQIHPSMTGYAKGGLPHKYEAAAPKGHNPEFITGVTGYYACGGGTGQSDDIPAMLHDGDYVMDAETVSALGDGSSKAGMHVLDGFRNKVHHSEKIGDNPVPAKIADGEYVFPSSFVTALGKGDNKHGAEILDGLREKLREHKRGAPTDKIPPKAKSPLDYIKKGKE